MLQQVLMELRTDFNKNQQPNNQALPYTHYLRNDLTRDRELGGSVKEYSFDGAIETRKKLPWGAKFGKGKDTPPLQQPNNEKS